MKKTLHILYYTIISILIPLPCLSVSPQKGNILFIDEFNENSIIPDSSIWKLCTYGNHTWGQHFKNVEGYENVKVENGVLKLLRIKILIKMEGFARRQDFPVIPGWKSKLN